MTAPSDPLLPFLTAIADDLDDDVPRLQLADWLEECGDPRGEFLRVACFLTRAAVDDPRRLDLLRRDTELRAQYDKHWRGKPPSGFRVAYTRGMLAVEAMAPSLLRSGASAWWKKLRPWVVQLTLTWCEDDNFRDLVVNGTLVPIPELLLPGHRLTAEGIRALVTLPHWRALHLPPTGTEHTPELRRLVALPHLRRLSLSSLSWSHPPSFPVVDLTLLTGLRTLRTLALCHNHVGEAGLAPLAALPELRRLDLKATGLADNDLVPLRQMTRLRHLSLWGNRLSPAALADLRAALPDCDIFGP